MSDATDDRPDRRAIQFRVHVDHPTGPPADVYALEARLRAYIFGRRWDCYLGALGGAALTYGVVFDPRSDLTAGDRNRLADWLGSQPIRATVHQGDPEPVDRTDVSRSANEVSFRVGLDV